MRNIDSLGKLAGKKVLLRCDFNVPLEDGQITDDGRIRAALPTINKLVAAGAAIIIASHLGRPEAPDPKLSLAPVARRLGEILGQEVFFATDSVGSDARGAAKALLPGGVVVLENLRFQQAETSKEEQQRQDFAAKLAAMADVFISDGFGVVHRKQASVFELPKLLPSAAGLLIEREVSALSQLQDSDKRPYTVVLGGSKVSDKVGVIGSLLPRVDNLLIGGGMAFTFLAAEGHRTASSLLEQDQIETARKYIDLAANLGVNLLLPTDVVMANAFSSDAQTEVANVNQLEETAFGEAGIGLDIGPQTSQRFAQIIRDSKLCFWNGPMGVFEFAKFAEGTREIATALSQLDGLSVVGGGDSAAAVRLLGFSDDAFGHISTGGGASLEYLEGKKLPGLEVLDD